MNAAFESALSFVLMGLWRATWQATLLAGVVLILQTVLGKRLGGRGRFALWAIVVVRLLLPVLPESRFSVFNLSRWTTREEHKQPIVAEPVESEIPIIVIGAQTSKPQAAMRDAIPTNVAAPIQTKHSISWSAWIFAAWIAGVLTLALRVAQVCWELSLTIRSLADVQDPALLSVIESCAKTLRLKRIPRVLAGDTVQTPAVVGLFRPKLLLPSHVLAKCDQREIRLIVLHELAHLKRHDIAGNWLIALASIVHWFNPIVWLLGARMRADRELACDELVLAHSSGEARAYGQTLVKLIEILSPSVRSIAVSPRQLAIVGILESTTPMQRRVRMIAQFDPKQSRRWIWTIAVLALLAGCALTDSVKGEKSRASSTRPSTQPGLVAGDFVMDGSETDTQLQGALAKVLPEVKFENTPLSEVMEFMHKSTGANLVVMWRALESAGIARENQVTVSLKNVTVAQALDHILADVGGGLALAYAIDNGAIVVSTQEDMSKHTKTIAYGVEDLIVAENGKPRQEAVDHLIKVVMDLAARDTWDENGGTSGTIREFNGKLIVQNTPAAQAEVAELLKLLKSERPAQTVNAVLMPGVGFGAGGAPVVNFDAATGAPVQQAMPHTIVSDEEIEAANKQAMTLLKKKLPEVRFDALPLSDVIDFYRDTTGANLFVNWTALELAGIDKSAQVTLRLRDTSFDTVLTATLRQVNAQKLTVVIDRGVITVTTREELPGYLLTKTYDVKTFADSPAEMQSLCNVVQTITQPNASVQFFGTRLVVTATPGEHEQIQKLLADFATGKPTTRPIQ